MSDIIDPAWLEACGFKKDRDSSSWRKEHDGKGMFVRLQTLFASVYRVERIVLNSNVEILATRSSVRSAWHALTGQRLQEPYQSDLADESLCLCDKLDDDGFPYHAEFIREALRVNSEEVPKLKARIAELERSWQDERARVVRIANGYERFQESFPNSEYEPRFQNDSSRDIYCDRCEQFANHVVLCQSATGAPFVTCRRCQYGRPFLENETLGVIRLESGQWRIARAGEAFQATVTRRELVNYPDRSLVPLEAVSRQLDYRLGIRADRATEAIPEAAAAVQAMAEESGRPEIEDDCPYCHGSGADGESLADCPDCGGSGRARWTLDHQ